MPRYFPNSMQRFIQSIILSSLLVLIAPIAAANDALVTRGDFIRDAIKAMDIDVSEVDESGLSEYVRVPRGLRPYIAYAHNRGALRLFGKDLTLGRGITRGQAVQVVVKLGNFEPASPPSNFRDVRKGTAAEGAVGIALDQGWLQPLRDDIFGTNRMLGFQDAVDFLVVLGGSDSIRPSDIPNQDQP